MTTLYGILGTIIMGIILIPITRKLEQWEKEARKDGVIK